MTTGSPMVSAFHVVQRDLFFSPRSTFVLLVLAAPLQSVPGLSSSLVYGLKLGFAILFVLQMLIAHRQEMTSIESGSHEQAFLWLLAAVFLSALCSISVPTSLLAVIRLVVVIAVFRSFRSFLAGPEARSLQQQIMLVMAVVYCGLGIVEFAASGGRVRSVFENANSLGQFSALLAVAFLGERVLEPRAERQKPWWNLALAVAVGGLLLSLSRSSWLLFLTGSSIILLVRYGRRAVYGLAAAAAVVGMVYAAFARQIDLLLRLETRLSYRDVVWRISWEVFQDHWLTGAGPGTLATQIGSYFFAPASGARTTVWSINFSAHNDLLQVASEMGIVTLIPYLGLLGFLFARAIRGFRSAAPGSCAWSDHVIVLAIASGAAVAGLFETVFVFGGFSVALFLWLYVARSVPLQGATTDGNQ